MSVCGDAEEWRPVLGFEGFYRVSSLGRVMSEDRIISVVRRSSRIIKKIRGRILKPTPDTHGYRKCGLSMAGIYYTRKVSVLVAQAFLGAAPHHGAEVCHGDGTRDNDRLENLRWDTRKGNAQDTLIHGTRMCGIKHHKAKLTEEDVRAIRRSSLPNRVLGARFGVSHAAVGYIKRHHTWRHLREPSHGGMDRGIV